jgi:hypothetical protein
LSGYVALAETAEVASRFDPLVEFYEMRAEVKKRRPLTIASRMGKQVDTSETTDDPIFRQRAAVVFERLLEAIKTDQTSKANRLGTVDLFNAAAVASEADMDFVSVQLMEAAASLDVDIPVEIEARLIRQQVSLSRITDQKAIERLKAVMQRTTGYDVHLVASEAYNICQKIARPSETAKLVMDHVSTELRNNSYVLLNGARMMGMGSQQEDWDIAKDWAIKGVSAFLGEPKSVRWYESSQEEIIRLRDERPDIKDLFGEELDERLGNEKRSEGPTPSDFLAMLRAMAEHNHSIETNNEDEDDDADKDRTPT